jgi:RHS repeat-associated protein
MVIQPRGTNSYAYHPVTGRLSSITAPEGVMLKFAYDGALLTTETWAGPVTGSINRSYNVDFEIISDKVFGSPPIAYKYDADGLLIQAGELFLMRSPLNSLITGTKLGGISETFTDNIFGELVESATVFNGLPLLENRLTHDKLGRITARTETIEGITTNYKYDYNLAGQLVKVIKNDSTNAVYTNDSNNNRISLLSPTGTITAVCDNQDRLIQYGTNVFNYTAAGELRTKTNGTAVTNYEYDVIGNLVRVTLLNRNVIDYVVDGRNRRIGRKVNGVLDKGYLYQDGLRISAELDSKGKVVSRFVYASRPNVPDYIIKGSITYRIVADYLGSPRIVVNIKTGKIVQRIDYDEFGNILTDTDPGFQPFGFAGGLYDPDTGLTRFGLRDYEAQTGRWTTKDPLPFQGEDTNPYSYVRADPINARDAFGLQMNFSSGLSLTGPLVEGAFREIAFQAAMAGFTVTGRNEKSGHNVGSRHYQGNAIDIRTCDKSDKEVEDFIKFMSSQGYTVKDERVRPPGQKVWSGPHVHIEVPTSKLTPKPSPRVRPTPSGVCAPPL